ncbi:ABC transporter substrate-binding protein [Nonomuraea rubra]
MLAGLTAMAVASCGSGGGTTSAGTSGGGGDDSITMGFSQVGAESGWRTANTKSVQDSAKNAGITLKFSDAQQKQENQIKAIRSYIQQKVDVIAFSPVVESGWDTVLKEAQNAKIPVILTDRAVDSKDTSLYKTFLGSDFIEEGKKAGQWLVDEYKDTKDPVNIVELQGTTGSAPANDRKAGFAEIIQADPKFKYRRLGRRRLSPRAKGKEVMEAFLKSTPDIDVLYAHNDDMGLGRDRGHRGCRQGAGKDIKIITVDAGEDGMQALADGKINLIVECSPLPRPAADGLAKKVRQGRAGARPAW